MNSQPHDPETIRGLLGFSALETAEKIYGRQGERAVQGHAVAMHRIANERKEALLSEAMDTYYSMPWKGFLDVLGIAGFEHVHEHLFKGGYEDGSDEIFIIAAHQYEPLLASASSSSWDGEDRHLSNVNIYGAVDISDAATTVKHVATYGLGSSEPISPVSVRDWKSGDPLWRFIEMDGREALRLRLSDAREQGVEFCEWPVVADEPPTLVDLLDRKERELPMTEAKILQIARIAELPDHVQQFMGVNKYPEPVDFWLSPIMVNRLKD